MVTIELIGPDEAWAPSAISDAGAYSAEARTRVYRCLRERADWVLRSGRNAILDATFASRAERERVLSWAQHEGLRPWLLHTVAPDSVTEQRLRARSQAAEDPSDAGPELLRPSRESFEPPDEWPADRLLTLETHTTDWEAELEKLASRIRSGAFA